MSAMAMRNDMEDMVNRYLAELATALGRLPAARREQLVGEIRDHITQMRQERAPVDLSDMEALLNRVGLPEDIAAVAFEDFDELAPDPLVPPPEAPRITPVAGAHSPPPRPTGRAWAALRRRPAVAWMGATIVVLAALVATLALLAATGTPAVRRSIAFALPVGPRTFVVPPARATVLVPDVVGLQSADALAIDAAAGFKTTVVSVHSSAVPAGVVVSQSPQPGAAMPASSVITLTVSEGPATTPST